VAIEAGCRPFIHHTGSWRSNDGLARHAAARHVIRKAMPPHANLEVCSWFSFDLAAND
jgi:hypothetical protein